MTTFAALAEHFEELDSTRSGNEMTEILSRLFEGVEPDEIAVTCYFTLGEVDAEYRHVTLDMGEKMVMEALAEASGRSREDVEEVYDDLGDLGRVAEKLDIGDGTERGYFSTDEPSVLDVHDGFMEIAGASGSGSQGRKVKTLSRMLNQQGDRERRYLTRIATGTLRLGVGDMTILDGLADAFAGGKENRPALEEAYNLSSDIGLVAETAAEAYADSGDPEEVLDAVSGIESEIGRPIKMMLAQRLKKLSDIMAKMPEEAAAEWKYDGERMQCHKDGDEVHIFSRRLDDITSMYPDVEEYVRDHVDAERAIVEGEAVAFRDGEMQTFQTLMQRKRKYDVEEYVERIPVKLILFDVLWIDDEDWMERPYLDRREKLDEITETGEDVRLTEQIVTDSQDDIDEFFERGVNEGTEGIIVKSTAENSVYRAGARKWLWIKWKKDYMAELADTFDLVVVGGLAGRGSRAGTYGALLCATYNHDEDRFETLCKVGTGFTDETLEELPERLSEWETDERPARVRSDIEPTQWFEPGVVVEIEGAELTRSPVHKVAPKDGKGLALRFPRFLRFRDDKDPDQATTSKEVEGMYGESTE